MLAPHLLYQSVRAALRHSGIRTLHYVLLGMQAVDDIVTIGTLAVIYVEVTGRAVGICTSLNHMTMQVGRMHVKHCTVPVCDMIRWLLACTIAAGMLGVFVLMHTCAGHRWDCVHGHMQPADAYVYCTFDCVALLSCRKRLPRRITGRTSCSSLTCRARSL